MTNSTYKLTDTSQLLHGASSVQLLRDHADDRNAEADALVASGDCFITLATALDAIHIDGQPAESSPELEKIITTLIYLQRHYAITKKHPNYRQ